MVQVLVFNMHYRPATAGRTVLHMVFDKYHTNRQKGMLTDLSQHQNF